MKFSYFKNLIKSEFSTVQGNCSEYLEVALDEYSGIKKHIVHIYNYENVLICSIPLTKKQRLRYLPLVSKEECSLPIPKKEYKVECGGKDGHMCYGFPKGIDCQTMRKMGNNKVVSNIKNIVVSNIKKEAKRWAPAAIQDTNLPMTK
jgi:hypothetical protein